MKSGGNNFDYFPKSLISISNKNFTLGRLGRLPPLLVYATVCACLRYINLHFTYLLTGVYVHVGL